MKNIVTLPWLGKQNMTAMMTMKRQSPEVRDLVDRSLQTAREWAREEMLESEKQSAAALSRRAVAEQLLGVKK